MRASRWVLLGAVVVVLLLGGGVWWYVSVPHTPEAQFAKAAQMEKELRAEALTKKPAELQAKIDEVVEQYRRVGTRFGKNPKAAEALKKIAGLQENIEQQNKKAMATLEQLGKEYPEEENAGYALFEEERLIQVEARALKDADKREDADKRYQDAIAKLDEFLKKFDKSGRAAEAWMEKGRIWMDGIEEPPIRAIDIFTQVLKDFPHSAFEPEAMLKLAQMYEKIKEYEKAVAIYTQLIELYPKSHEAADATISRGRLLADQLNKHDEAAKDFEKFAQNNPDDPRAQSAGQEARSEQSKAAEDQGKKYGESRYGGTVPFDTSADKALPPSEMLKQYIEEKLDAEKYDLNVTFVPKEHRISVEGTLKLTNRGADKKELLLMLGPGLAISKMTMDGAAAETKHANEALKITLPVVLKKDASTTLAFAYTGQYADEALMKTLQPGPGGGMKGARPATGTAPATMAAASASASASAPATAAGPKYSFDPQMALGDYGYALSGASWYPITIIGDVFDAHVVLNTPANVEAVSNGDFVKREKSTREGTPGRFEFQTKNPVFGLYFAYGPYVVKDKQVGAIHFYTYLRAANASKSDAYVEVANNILSFYASKFNGFPFEKMAVIETPLPPFLGGVGPASLMFLQETMVDHPEVPENLLAHELAHQWFGNLIPINMTDPGYNQWLSEGFATYCDALYTEHKDGPKAFDIHIQQYQQLFFEFEVHAPRGVGAIKDTMSPMSPGYRPVVYEKGALVLHMLRKVMGDEKFFRLLSTYVATFKNRPSTVDDFRHMASDIEGQDLSWFFAEWYDQTVFAHYKVSATVAPEAGGAASTKVMITQPDDLIKMPLDVTFIGANNQRQVEKDVLVETKEKELEIRTPFVPVKVVLDEQNWVLKRLGTDNIWQAPAAPASSPASRPVGA